MKRAELRRLNRLMGYRGVKAKRDKPVDPIMVHILQNAVRERMQREGLENPIESENESMKIELEVGKVVET